MMLKEYYANSGASNQQDVAGTWNSNYKLVYHLEETSGTSTDATVNNSDGTPHGVTQDISGKINGGDSFNGTSDYIDTLLDYDLSGNGAFSIFTWAKDIPAGSKYIISQSHTITPSYASDWILGYTSNGLWFRSQAIGGGNQLGGGSWHHFGFTFDGTNAKLYVDGDQYGGSVAPTGYGAVGSVKLMTRGDATSGFCAGSLDEVRISNTNRSEDWIKTSYESQNSPSTFYTIASEESEGSSNATWKGNEDTSSTLERNSIIRLRIQTSNEGNSTISNTTYRIEYGIKSSTCAAISSWTAIPNDNTEHWRMATSTYLADGNATTDLTGGLTDENTTFEAGQVKETSNQTSGITLTSSEFTEIEYSIKATDNASGNYCFRLTNAGLTTYFTYTKYAEAVVPVAVSIALTDGTVSFGTVDINTTVDSSGDVQVITIETGPADLDIRTTIFSQGGNNWSLGESNGDNQIKWEFATSTGGTWHTFSVADTLYNLADNLAQAATSTLYLRLTMPTVTDSYNEYGSTITIVASSP